MWRPLRVTPERAVCSRFCVSVIAIGCNFKKEPLREACNVPRISHLRGFLALRFPGRREVATSLPVWQS